MDTKLISAVFITVLLCAPAFGATRSDMSRSAAQRTESREHRGSAESARTATTPRATANNATVQSRTATAMPTTRTTMPRTATNTAVQQRATAATATRSVTSPRSAPASVISSTVARSALVPTGASMGGEYNQCRDAYFTCMDQFCGTLDDTYRRCMCSSRLDRIREQERKLKQTGDQLQDFSAYNIEAITKTAAEVNAMVKATVGEQAASNSKDKSDSASALAGVSSVLSGAKTKALSNSGSLDIAGDVNQIWSSSDMLGAADLANMDGIKLYEQVHAQCLLFSTEACPRRATMNMVVSAYGMYIENDCNIVSGAIEGKRVQAQAAVRQTSRDVGSARLENYDAHNSAAINDCIAQVRTDITDPSACGSDFTHCLDATGLYLNRTTGAPIYSAEFYKLENQISLEGNILKNNQNVGYLSLLENVKQSAKRGLDTCRDLSAGVWDEFKRQAIIEIYQGQQKRIRQVKEECLDVLNACYDEQLSQLKDFSNVPEHLLLGQRVELSEELCRIQLDTCSNLYGGGSTGKTELVTLLRSIGSSKISDNCQATLENFVKNLCTPPAYDIENVYPYSCRIFSPGEIIFALRPKCNESELICPSSTPSSSSSQIRYLTRTLTRRQTNSSDGTVYTCQCNCVDNATGPCTDCPSPCEPKYNGSECGCEPDPSNEDDTCECSNKNYSEFELSCDAGFEVSSCSNNGNSVERCLPNGQGCGVGYNNSLLKKLVIYARDFCERPSEAEKDNFKISSKVMRDVSEVFANVSVALQKELKKVCESDKMNCISYTDFGNSETKGIWINSGGSEHPCDKFREVTNANPLWGRCDFR
ncbi:MAG: hypothetical protein FWG80_02830 [Alphaproteobacteria bacterium]|nr:hypothetical protein [Alphaproteobacteria bacterium]